MALEAHQFPEFALPAYREAAYLAPADMRPRYFQAVVLDGMGRSAEAIALLRELAEDPAVPPSDLHLVHLRLGEALLAAGKAEEAEQAFALAVGLAPNNGSAALGFGRAMLANGKAAAAIPELERAGSLLGPDRAVQAALAEAYRLTGQPDAAAAEARRAEGLPSRRVIQDDLRLEVTRLRPEYRLARELGAMALQLGRYEDAVADLQRVVAAWPDDASAHSLLAVAYQRAGQTEAAQRHRERAEELAAAAGAAAPGAAAPAPAPVLPPPATP
jgi:Flp pilus assembly protein TadD